MQSLSDLIPVLMTVVCTEGYHCGGSSEITYHRVPSWDACIQSITNTKIVIPASEEEAQFAMMATCVYKHPSELK